MSETARRSDRSKAAILAAAQSQFQQHGYEGTTLRAISAEAGIDVAMLIRYFGSKQGLFDAATDIDLDLPDLTSADPAEVGSILAEHFLTQWEGPNGPALRALLTAALPGTAPAARIADVFRSQVAPALRLALADDPEYADRAALVSSQLLGFALGRYVLRLPPLLGLSRESATRLLGAAIQSTMSGGSDDH
ncbi:TetR/AcrR family transcriptional regulator [Leifsonia sp. AG29]|uniref:TetR/AcrR family transcriptional regulator n=1 Tax=Leifsonia sp. AG29 TaxID=2598860 RepID=UPI00131DEDA5|nr:TetR family transcriptional regulator [Leifsonia sp. AG29]